MLHCRNKSFVKCLDADVLMMMMMKILNFLGLKSVSNRLQHGSGVKPFSLFYFCFLCLAVLVNERFVLVRVILAYGHSSSCISI